MVGVAKGVAEGGKGEGRGVDVYKGGRVSN